MPAQALMRQSIRSRPADVQSTSARSAIMPPHPIAAHPRSTPFGRRRRRLAATLLFLGMSIGTVLVCVAAGTPDATAAAASAAAARPGASQAAALRELRKASKAAHSDVLIVWRDGQLLAEDYSAYGPDQYYETMSATKGVVALAIGLLLQEGKIKSLDQPVADFFPEWRQGRKAKITIRHLMTHTSGLQNVRTTDIEIYPSPDFVQLALAADVSDEPGSRWAYNNKATNLIPGLVRRVSGMPIDEYMKTRLFDAIGLREFQWMKDAAGNPHGMAGFQTSGREFLKLGVFVLNRGRVGDRQLISPEFFDVLATSGAPEEFPSSGHLWWLLGDDKDILIDDELLTRMRARGVDPGFVDKLAQIKGVYSELPGPFKREEDPYIKAMTATFGPDFMTEVVRHVGGKTVFPKVRLNHPVGMAASGSYGQELIVIPDQKLVIVRMVTNGKPGFDEMRDSFMTLKSLALELAAAYRDAASAQAGR
jgi:CubicO group peptidase (beta-lactamase class C family)